MRRKTLEKNTPARALLICEGDDAGTGRVSRAEALSLRAPGILPRKAKVEIYTRARMASTFSLWFLCITTATHPDTSRMFSVITIFILLLWTAFAFVYVAYYKLFHPLAKYPGPFWASLTDLWSLRLSVAGDWPQRMNELHARYGPIVRIAPNEVAIDDPRAIKDICRCHRGASKGPRVDRGFSPSRWFGKGVP